MSRHFVSNCLDGLAPVDKSSHLHSSAPVQSIAVYCSQWEAAGSLREYAGSQGKSMAFLESLEESTRSLQQSR